MKAKPGSDLNFRCSRRRAFARKLRSDPGFTLIEIVVVLLIFGVLFSMAAVITRGVAAAQKRSITASRMAAVDAAILQFVQQQKRMPCPGDGTLASNNAAAGTEGNRTPANGCTGNQQNGVVPWRALGITENDASDGWDRRLTLRVDAALAADNGMNLAACDPAGSAAIGAGNQCNTACTNATLTTACTPPSAYLLNKGLKVKNIAGTVLMDPTTTTPHTGAAYVLISPGETGGGGYMSAGVLGASTTTDGTEEMKNYASLPYVSLAATYYVDDTINDTGGANHFDDLVSHPSVMAVASKAGLGPRSH